MINGNHSQERSYDGRTNTKKFTLSKKKRLLLRARSTLRTPCEQGSGCAGTVVSAPHAVEEFPWYLSALALRICACSPAAGQRIGSTGDWPVRSFCVAHHHVHRKQAGCFPLGASACNSSVLRQVTWWHASSLLSCHTACRVSCMDAQKIKSLQSHVNLRQNESGAVVVSSYLAFLTKTYEYNIPPHWFPAEISIKNLHIAAL